MARRSTTQVQHELCACALLDETVQAEISDIRKNVGIPETGFAKHKDFLLWVDDQDDQIRLKEFREAMRALILGLCEGDKRLSYEYGTSVAIPYILYGSLKEDPNYEMTLQHFGAHTKALVVGNRKTFPTAVKAFTKSRTEWAVIFVAPEATQVEIEEAGRKLLAYMKPTAAQKRRVRQSPQKERDAMLRRYAKMTKRDLQSQLNSKRQGLAGENSDKMQLVRQLYLQEHGNSVKDISDETVRRIISHKNKR